MRGKFPSRIMSIVFVFLFFAVLQQVNAEEKAARVFKAKIETVQPEYGATAPLSIRFTLTNTSDKPMHVLTWQTPLEGFNGNIFRVTRDGVPVMYVGKVVKRGAPRPEDYRTVEPGKSIETEVDLSQAYAIYEPGDYSVEFASRLYDFGEAKPQELARKTVFAPESISSNAVTFKLTGERKRPEEPVTEAPKPTAEGAAAKAPVFKNCSQSQQNDLNSALTEAKNISTGSYLCLKGLAVNKRSGSPRYKTWFGAYDAGRWDTATNDFDKIYNVFANKTVTFNCGCNTSDYAYVYPNKPYEIYLCNAFWTAPLSGTDSKGGTLVHETSHFYAVASTSDYAYGQASCKNLAINTPTKAIANADSHEYFAENNPAQSCGLDHLGYSLAAIFSVIGAALMVRGRGRGSM